MGGVLTKHLEKLDLRQTRESGKDGNVVTITFKPPTGFATRLMQFLWTFALIHYIFYGFLMAAVAVVFRTFLLNSTTAKAVVAVSLILYLPSFFDGSEKNMGRPWDTLRCHPIWSLTQGYFPAKLVRTHKLDPRKKYVFGWHPHGILILSRIHAYGGAWEALFPGIPIRVLGATPMFFVPGCREICLWFGAVDAGRKTAEKVLRNGVSVVVYPGGSKEIFSTDPNSRTTTLHLTKRKGFVKLAVSEKAHLVPTFVFGEKKCYSKLNVPAPVSNWLLRNLKLPLIVFWGRFGTWYPYKAPQTVVFGKPIDTDMGKQSDEKMDHEKWIDLLHRKYVDAVVELFETHKTEAGYGPEETLVVL